MQKILKIQGMHCKSCAALVESDASDLDYVTNAKVDLANNTLSLELDSAIQDSQLLEDVNDAIKDDNFTASL